MSYLQELHELARPFREMRELSDSAEIYARIFEDRDVNDDERQHALAFLVEELEALAAHLRQVLPITGATE